MNEIGERVICWITLVLILSVFERTCRAVNTGSQDSIQAPQEASLICRYFSAPAFQNFTDAAIKVTTVGQEESKHLGHNFVGSEQLLLGLLCDGGIAGNQFRKMSITLYQARREVEKIIGRGSGYIGFEIPFTSASKVDFVRRQRSAEELETKLLVQNISCWHYWRRMIASPLAYYKASMSTELNSAATF